MTYNYLLMLAMCLGPRGLSSFYVLVRTLTLLLETLPISSPIHRPEDQHFQTTRTHTEHDHVFPFAPDVAWLHSLSPV